jgi:CheY-like chemotaxis protein
MPENRRILWADDEIEMLNAHILFLNQRGYDVVGVTNAEDAIHRVRDESFDVVLLDEHMPGRGGLETLSVIKDMRPDLPVIMITKSEEESLMEEAIGAKISDYLTKPVNPSQILSALKKVTQRREFAQKVATRDYLAEFRNISQKISEGPSWKDWLDIHAKLSAWEVELDSLPDEGLKKSLEGQRIECNVEFAKFIEENYEDWIWDRTERPPLSVDFCSQFLAPKLKEGRNVLFLVIDCLRLDQWLALEPMLYEYYTVTRDYYYSILPSATPYARNALFSGHFPADIETEFPDLWQRSEDDEFSSNRFEHQFLDRQLTRLGLELDPEPKYVKILDAEEANATARKVQRYFNNRLVSMVFNFMDILAHSRAQSEVIKEMTPNEAAYRSVIRAWFEHSSLFQILKSFAAQNVLVVLTTDHGSIRGMKAARVVSDKEASTNLRYKYGRNLRVDRKHALICERPEKFRLPRRGLSVNYIFAKEYYYFIYPTNYHKYLNLYKDSFQHGGISLEEMVLPVVYLEPKR